MDQSSRDHIAHKFDFEAWKSVPGGDATLSIGGLFDVGSELDRWTVGRAQVVTFPRARAARQSMWQESPSAEVILRLDLIEAASTTTAREIVLELLGEFQSPQIQRLADPPAGDLAFSAPGDSVMLFARANVVALVRNAGRVVVGVAEFARLVDHRLTQ